MKSTENRESSAINYKTLYSTFFQCSLQTHTLVSGSIYKHGTISRKMKGNNIFNELELHLQETNNSKQKHCRERRKAVGTTKPRQLKVFKISRTK